MAEQRTESLLSFSVGTPLHRLADEFLLALHSLDCKRRDDLRLKHCSANLDGQKALTAHSIEFSPSSDVRDSIVALRTCYVVFAKLISVSAVRGRGWYPSGLEPIDDRHHDLFECVIRGNTLAEEGITENDDFLEFGWPATVWNNAMAKEIQEVAALADEVVGQASLPPDPFQYLYPRILPPRLLHATGEFYTPFWMAELLLRDLGWDGASSLVDPFCGSGVFLLAAMDHAARLGISPLKCLDLLRGIELNSAACAGARANIMLRLRPHLHVGANVKLPILCGDSIHADWQTSSSLFDPPPKRSSLASEVLRSAVLLTNPPWVGWEYIPRDYRDSLQESWCYYQLFTATGLNKAFLKEDLSTLAVATALDRYLETGGTAALVMRPASMRSNLAGRELRRMRIAPSDTPLGLTKIREFSFRTFDKASVPAATWILRKGVPTSFPVPVEIWGTKDRLGPQQRLSEIEAKIESSEASAHPVTASDPTSAWLIEDAAHHVLASSIYGKSDYQARVGVFTGGANAVFYLEPLTAPGSRFRNITERAKKRRPQVEVELEPELVYEIVRGRDIQRWHLNGFGHLLFPHTVQTRMDAIGPTDLRARFPRAWDYLESQKEFLTTRNGFTQWERPYLERAFYCLQRIGEYTFAPFKVCWKFVSSDFDCVVVGPDSSGRPRLANDKVMFIGVDNEAEAFYLCGVLSSELFRRTVMGSNVSTQISTSAIAGLAIERFSPKNSTHKRISEACCVGHRLATRNEALTASLRDLNELVAELYNPAQALRQGA
jgi:N-6 DNA Methylase